MNQHNLLGHRIAVAGTDIVVFTCLLDKNSKPFPGDHPVSGTEIVPAACLLNTFLNGTKGNQLKKCELESASCHRCSKNGASRGPGAQAMPKARINDLK